MHRNMRKESDGGFPCAAEWISFRQKNDAVYEFEKSFGVREDFLRAEVRIAALGFYDATVNGRRVRDTYFKPYFTDYKLFSYYETYDLADFVVCGENKLHIRLAGGYYQNEDRAEDPEYPDLSFGNKAVRFAVAVYYADGTEIFGSDADTLSRCLPTVSTLFRGDRVDFSAPSPHCFDAVCVDKQVRLLPSPGENDRICETFAPIVLYESDKKKIYDFGQNHTGGIRCKITGKRGDRVTVTYAERLKADGSLDTDTSAYPCVENGRSVLVPQRSEYVLSGGEDEIEPLFSWRCYRYICVESGERAILTDLESCFIHTAVPRAGDFGCSMPLFCEIYEKYVYTQWCNMHSGVPTDCPHREKLPYTGDGQITARSMMYCFDAESFLRKWLDDIIASAAPNGYVPNTAPNMGAGGGYFWGYAVAEIPRVLYRFTGNVAYIERAYPAVLRWVKYLGTRHTGNYILTIDDRKWALGDWLAPEPVRSSGTFFDTVCYYASVTAAAEMHFILHGTQNEDLRALARKIRAAIHRAYYHADTGTYAGDEQGETVLALYYGIPEKEDVPCVVRSVERHYNQIGKHFDTGIVLTPILLRCCRKYGMDALAYELMTQTDYPSFAYMLRDETTFPEHWSKKWIDYKFSEDDDTVVEGGGELSHCHPMFGSVTQWLYESVAGLDISALCDGTIYFRPAYTDRVNRAHASGKTPFGTAAIEYDSQNGLTVTAEIPSGLRGAFVLPHGAYRAENAETKESAVFETGEFRLPSGKWHIIWKRESL